MADNINNELLDLMRELAKSNKSMSDNMQIQTSRQEKLMLNTAAKEDAKRTEQFHKEQQEKLNKSNELGEENKSTEEQSLEVQQKILESQKKSNNDASYYLQTLAKLTQQNKDSLNKLTDATVKSPGALGKGATTLAGVRDFFQVPGERGKTSPVGLLGDVASIGSDLLSLTKRGKEGLSNLTSGSNSRQKRIKSNQEQIRNQKIALSSEKFRLEQAEKSGDKKGIKKYSSRVKDAEGALKTSGTTLSKDITEEYLRQQKKRDSSYLKGFDSDVMGSIRAQQENNILASIMGDTISPNKKALSGSIKPPNKKKLSKKERKKLNAKNNQANNKKTKGMSGQDKYQANERSERRSEELLENFMTSPISASDSPSNYGEYIAGTYNQLEKLNEKLDDMTSYMKRFARQRKSDDKSDDNDGGFGFGTLLRGLGGALAFGVAKRLLPKRLTGALAKLAGGKKTKLGRGLRDVKANQLRTARNKARAPKKAGMFSKAKTGASKVLSKGKSLLSFDKNTTKAGGKSIAKAGGKPIAKAGGKSIAKVGSKALGKSLLKKIPLVGALAGLGFGLERIISDGDWAGGGLEVLSGLASTIPGAGTAASAALDVGLAARDVGAFDSTPDSMPKLTQPKFSPQSSEMDTSDVSQNKVSEYKMLSKMIANEMVRVQVSDIGIQVATNTATINANAVSAALRS